MPSCAPSSPTTPSSLSRNHHVPSHELLQPNPLENSTTTPSHHNNRQKPTTAPPRCRSHLILRPNSIRFRRISIFIPWSKRRQTSIGSSVSRQLRSATSVLKSSNDSSTYMLSAAASRWSSRNGTTDYPGRCLAQNGSRIHITRNVNAKLSRL